ncbi:MAG: hypothetical protein SFW36_15745 [Leptolyngbyaceae cyanobacterium bins.59]|nr:hypothetical protein [Leptolyngbyaceae cyanobacterium bins.59]
MVRAIEQIDRELAHLEQEIAVRVEELRANYQDYLLALGQSVRQQMILASYHLCTQGYPEQFLKLSFDQRQNLQQALKQLARQTQEQLAACQEGESGSSEIPLEEDTQEQLTQLLNSLNRANTGAEEEPSHAIQLVGKASEGRPILNFQSKPKFSSPLIEAMSWQEQVERSIASVLQSATRKVNLLFKQADLFPGQVPLPVLDAAARAAVPNEGAGPPNILRFLVDTSPGDRPSETGEGEVSDEAPTPIKLPPLQIMTVHLRLSEIEFKDSIVMSWRNKIRQLMTRLTTFDREYQKKQHERAIAQAESAWRMSWADD